MSYWQSINSNNFKIIKAKNIFMRLRGLYFRNKNAIVILMPCNNIHTLFFSKNIDLAFFDDNYTAIRIIRNFPSWKFSKCKKAKFVVERFSNPQVNWFELGERIYI